MDAAKASKADIETLTAEHAAAARRLSEALAAAEQLCATERSSSQAKLEEVREAANQLLGAERAAVVPILYGGSVKPGNAAELLGSERVDGVLVGGASLDPASFAQIVAAAP